MRLLELFCGTKSVSNAVADRFDEIVSVDILSKFNPTVCCDILQWDYTQYPTGYFDVIWASPPCTEYSKAKTVGVRNLQLADSIVMRTLQILDYFKPNKWYIENPQTGLLKSRAFMANIPYVDVDYCKYGYSYRKRTRIWTPVKYEGKLCKKDCGFIESGSHMNSCGNGYRNMLSIEQKYSIPAPLIQELFQAEP